MAKVLKQGREPHSHMSMSSNQHRFWVEHLLPNKGASNNTIMAATIEGDLDLALLTQALNYVIARHEILRTIFISDHGGAQNILSGLDVAIPCIDFSHLDDTKSAHDIVEHQLLTKPFDLGELPLFRIIVIKHAPTQHVLYVCLHHIICDGWSLTRTLEELIECYEGKIEETVQPPTQYSEYVRSENHWLTSPQYQEHQAWWKKYLHGAAPSNLLFDLSGTSSAIGRKHSIVASAAETRSLQELGAGSNASLFMVLLAAVAIAVARSTGQQRVLLGTISGYRDSSALEKTLGCFTNILCLPIDCAQISVAELISSIQKDCLEVWEHRAFPYEQMTEFFDGGGLSPLGILLVFHSHEQSQPKQLPKCTWTPREVPIHVSAFPLTIAVTPLNGGLSITLEYDAQLFSEAHMVSFGKIIHSIIGRMPHTTGLALNAYPQAKPYIEMAQYGSLTGGDQITLHGMFEQQVVATPTSVALYSADASITFFELNAWANKIANHLIELGLLQEECVAIYCSYSFAFAAAWLGIMKAGGCAIPFDINESPTEVAVRIRLAKSRILVTSTLDMGHASNVVSQTWQVNADECRYEQSVSSELPRVDARQLAYLIFTSGSTGNPKAVMGTHKAMVNRLQWMWREYPFSAGEMCAIKTSPSFVDSIWELFGPLCAGVPSRIIGSEKYDPAQLLSCLEACQATRLVLVPSLLRGLLPFLERSPASATALKFWVCSGEPLNEDLVTRFHRARAQDTLLNLYGTSEIAADVSCARLSKTDSTSRVSIGRPIDSCDIWILDENLSALPAYVEGEVYVAGIPLNRGYYDRPADTAERFLPSSFGEPGMRMYRTGDRGYYATDGKLYLCGRADRQIKRRGVRLDLSGLEARLEQLDGIGFVAFVHSKTDNHIYAILDADSDEFTRFPCIDLTERVALFVLTDDIELRLWERLSNRLPSAALPDRVFVLRCIPRTQSRKVDYKYLSDIKWPQPSLEFISLAATPTEQALIQLCFEITEKQCISPADKFLSIGMNSLHIVQLVHKISDQFSIRIGMAEVFRSVSIRRCAVLIDEETERVRSILQAQGVL